LIVNVGKSYHTWNVWPSTNFSEKLRLSHLGFGEPNGQVFGGIFVGETPEKNTGENREIQLRIAV